MTFLIVVLIGLLILGYIAGVFVIGTQIQEWCFQNGHAPVAWPWLFTCFFILVVPIAVIIEVVTRTVP